MSKLLVEVCPIEEVKPHPNADRLDIIRVKAWNVIVQKAIGLKEGDPVVYFPIDTVMPESLADKLGIKKYLSPVKGDTLGYRVRATRLRGEKSFGTIDHEVNGFRVGTDVAAYYGVWKYEAPSRSCGGSSGRGGPQGDMLTPHPSFHKYTDIEHLRNYPHVIAKGELVVLSEKIHGMNVRLGLIHVDDGKYEYMAGSHNVRRRDPHSLTWRQKIQESIFLPILNWLSRQVRETPFDGIFGRYRPRRNRSCQFWDCMTPNVRECLAELSGGKHDIVIFGELYGSGIQDMHYGCPEGARAFRAFDISVDGKYLDYAEKHAAFIKHNILTAPVLSIEPFDMEAIEIATDGPTQICLPHDAGKFRGREGVVVTPMVERHDPRVGRVIFKSVSVDYLSRANAEDN